MKSEPSEIFKVLGVETRVKILEHLKVQGPSGVKEMAGLLGVTPAAVSQHLKILRQAGLVRSERKGYWIPYSIDEKAMESCRQILNEVCTCGCRGSGKFRETELAEAGVERLKKYEKELRRELEIVQERLKKVEPKKH